MEITASFSFRPVQNDVLRYRALPGCSGVAHMHSRRRRDAGTQAAMPAAPAAETPAPESSAGRGEGHGYVRPCSSLWACPHVRADIWKEPEPRMAVQLKSGMAAAAIWPYIRFRYEREEQLPSWVCASRNISEGEAMVPLAKKTQIWQGREPCTAAGLRGAGRTSAPLSSARVFVVGSAHGRPGTESPARAGGRCGWPAPGALRAQRASARGRSPPAPPAGSSRCVTTDLMIVRVNIPNHPQSLSPLARYHVGFFPT